MSLIRVRASGEVMSRLEFAQTLPNVSLAANLTQYEFDKYGFDPVEEVPQPVVGEFEVATYVGVIAQEGGGFKQGWEAVPMSQEQIDQVVANKEMMARNQAKMNRAAAVDAIVVVVGEKMFDGDEISQNRMVRAIIAMNAAAQPTTFWTLADNETVEVTVAELEQALQLAGQAQTDIWAI